MENVLHDTVRDLIESTSDPDLYEGGDFGAGYRMALYNALSNIKIRIETYGVDVATYFGKFDPEEWLKAGQEYIPK